MKKLVLLIFLAISVTAFSQIEKPITKGNILLSGEAVISGTWINSLSEHSHFGLSFRPGAGYFVIDNLALGLNTNIGWGKTRTSINMEQESYMNTYTLGIGPYFRYYFNNGFFVKTETFFNYLNSKSSGGSGGKDKSYMITPGIGYAFFLNSKVSFEPTLSYQFIHNQISDIGRKTNSVLLEFKFNIFL